MSPPSLPALPMKLTPQQAAERLGVSRSLIFQLCREQRLTHYRVGGRGKRGRILIDEADLDALLTECRVSAQKAPQGLRHIHLD